VSCRVLAWPDLAPRTAVGGRLRHSTEITPTRALAWSLRSGGVSPSGAAAARDVDWEGVRLHVVTGKGGTGKTTVAAALAIALATGGRRTLLAEVEARQGIAQLFDTAPLPYEERRVAVAPGGGSVHALAVDPEEALLEYLDLFYRLGRAGKALERMGAIDFATTIAPGLRDVLLIGKVYEATRRRQGPRYAYDAVVLDAPPTGRITRFLNVNSEVAGLAKVGPVRNHADAIMSLLRSPQTVVHLVTLLEEMPVQETVDGVAELQSVGLPVGGIVVNMVRTPFLRATELASAAKGRLDHDAVAAGLKAAGLSSSGALVDALTREAQEHAERVALEKQERKTLAALDRPTYELPLLADGADLGSLYQLAEVLIEQGAA
jgi:anion-transporting  ArsA/GET3 family ATPase